MDTEAIVKTLITSLSAIITAFGVPQIIKNWNEAKKLKNSTILEKLKKAEAKNQELEKAFDKKDDQLKELQLRISVFVPIVTSQNRDNQELLELLRMLQSNSTQVNLTPTQL
tara:strand:+ start:23672 stop:24007 length:336 start_codon:yes stop_codon:yes gene_type:complete